MSTRAIIAVPTEKGFKTAWCWNNSYPNQLGRILRNKFTTKALADELVSYHSFSSLYTHAERKAYESWRREEDIDNEWHSRKFIELSNNISLLMDSHDGKIVAGKGKHGFFKDISDMLDQDINYVYVFDDGKWKLYK